MLTPTRLFPLFALSFAALTGCASADGSDAVGDGAAAMTAHGEHAGVEDFECTSVASSATDDRLKSTRVDVTIDIASTGKPSGDLVTGFEPSLHAVAGVGFGVSHVRDTTAGGQQVSVYKIDFGADSILPGATGGTLTIPTVYTHLSLAGSAALDVATLRLTPSNATATYKCKKDTRRPDPGPATDPGPTFEGSAKTVVANDPCAKKVAQAVMDNLIDAIEDEGVDVPDDFIFTKIDRTASGYATVVDGAKVPVVVAAGCKIVSMDISSAAGSIGE